MHLTVYCSMSTKEKMKLCEAYIPSLKSICRDHYIFLTIGQLLSDQRSRELLIESIQYCCPCLMQDIELRNSRDFVR